MKKIIAIIIAKDEEKMIGECIQSVAFCDEVIVVDGGSKDRTREICRKFGVVVLECPFTDFATARNKGLEMAHGEWILYIDADERVSPQLQNSIKDVVDIMHPAISVYMLQRQNFYFGNHTWPVIEHMERLFRREKLKGWFGVLHESAKFDGEKTLLSGFLLHYTHRDLHTMLAKTITWSSAEAKLRYDAHHSQMTWWRFFRVMYSSFFDSYISQKGYKAGVMGLVESIYQSFSMFVTYAKLWEMQIHKKV